MEIGVLVSGGVDSSVALHRLRDEGAGRLRAYYLKIWLEDELASLGECPWEEDLSYVREVCDSLEIPLEIVPLQREYHDRVVSYTIEELRAGRTPSPDIFCNQRIKYGAFHETVGDSVDRIASGHYARVGEVNGECALLKGVDPVKDQTYFLSHLSLEQLQRCLFPIGHLPKSEVRTLAHQYELPNRDRRDSQGICFLGKIRFDDFVEFHLGERPGIIVERETGTTLGSHRGTWFHTIGQRRGLGLSGGPWFVVGKDLDDDVVFVSHQEQLVANSRSEFDVDRLHWIGSPPGPGVDITTKLRHGATVFQCSLTIDPLQPTGHVTLDRSDAGVAPGQFAILYDGDRCLGGGVIR